eukprot:CAMPEP_0114685852 /NCGR_PEP_ID=MMETSP0191-20121206/60903_1 /TAXON_ID=126664 /ORGANISM="Sorites sp." /LENGTH=57 /DNA_ID=CAMNT_0001970771 /DNA_START=26 /DNA_END=195 /DNA_ORIENTATION=-
MASFMPIDKSLVYTEECALRPDWRLNFGLRRSGRRPFPAGSQPKLDLQEPSIGGARG